MEGGVEWVEWKRRQHQRRGWRQIKTDAKEMWIKDKTLAGQSFWSVTSRCLAHISCFLFFHSCCVHAYTTMYIQQQRARVTSISFLLNCQQENLYFPSTLHSGPGRSLFRHLLAVIFFSLFFLLYFPVTPLYTYMFATTNLRFQLKWMLHITGILFTGNIKSTQKETRLLLFGFILFWFCVPGSTAHGREFPQTRNIFPPVFFRVILL